MHRDRAGPAAQPPAHLALLLRAIAVGATLVVRLPEIALQLVVEIALQLQPYVRAYVWRYVCVHMCAMLRQSCLSVSTVAPGYYYYVIYYNI